MTEHEENLRDLAAMFAMAGLIMRGDVAYENVPGEAITIADNFMEARKPVPEVGIVAIKKRKKSELP